MCCTDMSRFRLNHPNPDLFHRSEWDAPGTISFMYVFYRLLMAVVMVGGLVTYVLWQIDDLGYKMLIYLTNQGFLLLTIHHLLYAIIVFLRVLRCQPKTMSFMYKLSWGLQNLSSTAALFITLVYWTLLHPLITYPTTTGFMFSIFLHGFNSVSCLMDIVINARPVQISHFYFSSFFGVYYAMFSFIYWFCGGKGGLDCDVECEDYIYPILNWGEDPWQALALVGGGVVVGMPVLQTFWWVLYKLRVAIRSRCSSGDVHLKVEMVDRA